MELQQDEWSLSGVTFGAEGQLTVIGWCGRNRGAKYYILRCSKCSQDTELFGEGLSRSVKSNLIKGKIPCGCSKVPKWTQEQFYTLCTRKAAALGYTFLGFTGGWGGVYGKIRLTCENHGEWDSGNIGNLINNGVGCPGCRIDASRKASREVNTKPDEVMVASFLAYGSFHPDTYFCRSERLDSRGYKVYWHMFCPECGETGESTGGNLRKGKRPCACSPMRQQECYINWIIDDHNNAVGIKFGVANNSKRRIKNQNRLSVYEVRQHSVYTFPDVSSCKAAERACKEELETGIVLKRDMQDGYSETTWAYNLAKVKAIYERFGGVQVQPEN